jgi:SHS2 domain-containing protein
MSRDPSWQHRRDRSSFGFEEIEHTADKSLRVYGRSREQLFGAAAAGMNYLMVGRRVKVDPRISKTLDIESIDAESLLVDWLSELAFWAETESMVFTRIQWLELTEIRLRATVFGDRVSELEKHIKAVTYHNLKIVQTDKGLEVTIVFDV